MINCSDAMEADVILLSANYDRTSSFGKGADKGPAAILECLGTQIEIFERFSRAAPANRLKIAHIDLGNLNRLSPEKMVDKVESELRRHYKSGRFVVLLGGEHSVSNAAFRAIASPDVTVVQIDAHADMREDDSDYNEKPFGRYAHSCVMRRAYELGLRTVQIGLRAYSKEEYDFMKQNRLTFFEWSGKVPPINTIINSIRTGKVYLTLDVDGIDPAHMPATGTPVQGGLEWYYVNELIRRIFLKKNAIAADIVEVAPVPGSRLTEYGAAQLCYNMIAWKFADRHY